MAATTTDPQELLERVFGYSAFRGQQRAVIDGVCRGEHALVLMPTGGGKSICYQIPALLLEGVAIVVSPLIALMQDQVDAMTQLGIRAAFVNSSLDRDSAYRVQDQALAGELDLLYVAPERLCGEAFQQFLAKIRIALFAIDEAHCVSQWGHDFRPEYLKLDLLARNFPAVPRLGLTATADAITRKEIRQRLGLEQGEVYVSSFLRPNLNYQVELKNNPKKQLLNLIREQHPNQAGIVYCLSRKRVEQTAQWLREQGVEALAYHAGLDGATRELHQRRFLREDGLVMVATVAFGMGIDKPDVRFVAHLDLPKSMEAYYQETGRAGRDGESSHAWMFYSLADVMALKGMLANSDAAPEIRAIEQQKLNALLAYAETSQCRWKVVLNYFDENFGDRCDHCDNCCGEVQTWDGTEAAQKLLSCVFRCGQNFGSHHIVDVLLGERNDKVLKFGHENLSTFGIGKELQRSQWLALVRQLCVLEYLSLHPKYGSLAFGENTKALLKGEVELRLRLDLGVSSSSRPRKAASAKALELASLPEATQELFQRFKAWRKQQADEQGVPSYVVASDKTLLDISVYAPQSLAELKAIAGIGERKAEQYGGGHVGFGG